MLKTRKFLILQVLFFANFSSALTSAAAECAHTFKGEKVKESGSGMFGLFSSFAREEANLKKQVALLKDQRPLHDYLVTFKNESMSREKDHSLQATLLTLRAEDVIIDFESKKGVAAQGLLQGPQEFKSQFNEHERAKQEIKLSPIHSGELSYLGPTLKLLEKDVSQRPSVIAISETEIVSPLVKLQFLKGQLWSEKFLSRIPNFKLGIFREGSLTRSKELSKWLFLLSSKMEVNGRLYIAENAAIPILGKDTAYNPFYAHQSGERLIGWINAHAKGLKAYNLDSYKTLVIEKISNEVEIPELRFETVTYNKKKIEVFRETGNLEKANENSELSWLTGIIENQPQEIKITQKKEDQEKYLYRVVYGDVPKFDSNGYLLPVEIDGKLQGPAVLPLVHVSEWVTIARMFAWPKYKKYGQKAWLLKINKEKIKNLTNKEHDFLPEHGEYFGIVPREAIEQETSFTWEKDASGNVQPKLESLQ